MVQKKSIAPQELGELPKERRCKRCWQLLSQRELPNGSLVWWCIYCQHLYEKV